MQMPSVMKYYFVSTTVDFIGFVRFYFWDNYFSI